MQQEQQVLSLTPAELQRACKDPHALNLFAGLLMGDLMELEFPETHQAYWALLVNAALKAEAGLDPGYKELRFALGLPRGFAKTTIMKLFACWLIYYTSFRYFLIVSANATKAEAVIADIVGFLSRPNAIAIWGNWENETTKDTQKQKIFRFNGRPIILEALGSQSSVRGTNVQNERPGVIICEDIQEKECADSPELNRAFIAWFFGTLVKARNYRRSLIVYIGNMYNEECLLNQLRLSADWISLITAALLENGESIWPELRSKESIIAEYRSDTSFGQAAVFLAEVMNDPKAYASGWIDLSKIPQWPWEEDERPLCSFITIDPALGKDSSDDTALVAHGLFDGIVCQLDVVAEKLGDTQTVERGIQMALQYNCCLIAVEATAFQATLCNYFMRTLLQRGITGILVVPVTSGGIQKIKRIENYLKKCIKKEHYIHPRARAQIIFEASRINPLKKNNVDNITDAAAYGDKVAQENWHYLCAHFNDDAEKDDSYSRALAALSATGTSF